MPISTYGLGPPTTRPETGYPGSRGGDANKTHFRLRISPQHIAPNHTLNDRKTYLNVTRAVCPYGGSIVVEINLINFKNKNKTLI